MKPSVLRLLLMAILICGLGASALYSQLWSWTTPTAISDSISDNRNGIIKELVMNYSADYYLLWERSTDSNASDIYMKRFYGTDEPFAVVTGGDFRYINPQVIRTDYFNEDTLFYLFYESNQNGNMDIFYKVYTNSGFRDPQALAASPLDESHFQCNDNGDMVWQEGDKIKYCRLLYGLHTILGFSAIQTVDSINCSEPNVPPLAPYYYPGLVVWEKTENDSTAIFYGYVNQSRVDPILLIDSGNNTNLHFTMEGCSGYANSLIIGWDNQSGDDHTIYAYDFYGEYFNSHFSQQENFVPRITEWVMPVMDFGVFGFMTFINSSNQNSDVYVNDYGDIISPDLEYYSNLTNSPCEETNPAFFSGLTYWDASRDLILLWESNRNDHWQLFYSITTIGCGGGINEKALADNNKIDIAPNPCNKECNITYTLNENSSIMLQLFSANGSAVATLENCDRSKGTYTFHLNFDNIFPGRDLTGVFFVRLQTCSGSIIGKIINLN